MVLLSVALGGVWSIESHAYRDQRIATVDSHWPASATLALGAGKFHCVLFLHPHCPCTRATIAAVQQHLAEAIVAEAIVAETNVIEDWQFVFVQPAGVASDWHAGSNWARSQAISEVRCVLDAAGLNAQAFGAVASGHCFIFDDAGRKLFDGGLTAGRGMEGLCLGQKFLASLHEQSSPLAACTAPVYGCRLLESNK